MYTTRNVGTLIIIDYYSIQENWHASYQDVFEFDSNQSMSVPRL